MISKNLAKKVAADTPYHAGDGVQIKADFTFIFIEWEASPSPPAHPIPLNFGEWDEVSVWKEEV